MINTLIATPIIAAAFLFSPFPAAAEDTHHRHAPLTVDESLSLDALLRLTVETYPSGLEVKAREEEAAALIDRGQSWLSQRSSFTVHYQSDRLTDNENLDELEVGMEFPLWRWGQKSAALALGESAREDAAGAGLALRWQVSGLLRDVLWQMELTERRVALIKGAFEASQAMLNTTRRRFEVGELSRDDVLLAQNQALERNESLLQAEAQMYDARREYRILTGLDRRPAAIEEELSPRQGIQPDHPMLAAAAAELERARADRRYQGLKAKGGPTLTVGTRHERGAGDAVYDDSIGVGVSLPFGGAAHVNTEIAAANRELAAAAARLGQLRMQLDRDLHEAEHAMEIARQVLSLAEKRNEVYRQRQAMSETAFNHGEMDFLELLRLRNEAFAAEQDMLLKQIELKKSIVNYNQAVGELL